MATLGGAPKCPKCTKSVYMAEEIRCSGKSFHKLCFVCTTCRKSLDTTTVAEHDSNVYCKGCYGKQFGPKGYGYGVGAGTLSNTGLGAADTPVNAASLSTPAAPQPTPAPPRVSYTPSAPKMAFGSTETCGRCSKAVYLAEKIVGAGRVWHKACFTCTSCKRSLDSSTVQDKESELFCNACYKKLFGPKGFRGGTAGGMEHTQ